MRVDGLVDSVVDNLEWEYIVYCRVCDNGIGKCGELEFLMIKNL